MVVAVRDANVYFPALSIYLDTREANAVASVASLDSIGGCCGGALPHSCPEPPFSSWICSKLPSWSDRLHPSASDAAEIFFMAPIHSSFDLGVHDSSGNGNGVGALSDSWTLDAVFRRSYHAVATFRQQPHRDLFLRNLHLASVLHLDRAGPSGIALAMAPGACFDRIVSRNSPCSLLCNRKAND